MRVTFALVIVIIVTSLNHSLANESQTITCSDIKKNVAGWLVNQFSSDATKIFDVEFYLATNRKKQSVKIILDDWSQLVSSEFNVSSKTFLITHGYMSGGQKPWVLELKDALLESIDGNVIIVDWSDGSNRKNYLTAAKNTIFASNRIFNFLQALRENFRETRDSSSLELYNHLHLIGHSLGAHVFGQTAHLLKLDNFWKVDRITGLDPAKPCFTDVDANLRIDKDNAEFVDIIHTQTGKGLLHAFGMIDTLGHIDFYLNGGMVQPECYGNTFGYQEMICSHKLATKYFIEAIRDSNNHNCTFQIQRWNGSYEDAQMQIKFLTEGLNCNDCPKMGLDAVNSNKRGVFLVLTGTHEPYCKFDPDKDLRRVIRGINKLKRIKSIFDDNKSDDAYLPND